MYQLLKNCFANCSDVKAKLTFFVFLGTPFNHPREMFHAFIHALYKPTKAFHLGLTVTYIHT